MSEPHSIAPCEPSRTELKNATSSQDFEYTPPREVREIDLALGSVIVSEPNPKVRERLNLDWSSHDQFT